MARAIRRKRTGRDLLGHADPSSHRAPPSCRFRHVRSEELLGNNIIRGQTGLPAIRSNRPGPRPFRPAPCLSCQRRSLPHAITSDLIVRPAPGPQPASARYLQVPPQLRLHVVCSLPGSTYIQYRVQCPRAPRQQGTIVCWLCGCHALCLVLVLLMAVPQKPLSSLFIASRVVLNTYYILRVLMIDRWSA